MQTETVWKTLICFKLVTDSTFLFSLRYCRAGAEFPSHDQGKDKHTSLKINGTVCSFWLFFFLTFEIRIALLKWLEVVDVIRGGCCFFQWSWKVTMEKDEMHRNPCALVATHRPSEQKVGMRELKKNHKPVFFPSLSPGGDHKTLAEWGPKLQHNATLDLKKKLAHCHVCLSVVSCFQSMASNLLVDGSPCATTCHK